MYKVLSIDGGGIWGIGVAKYMYNYEIQTGKKFGEQFVAFAGTSTGAIIAALLSEGYSGTEIYDLYKTMATQIFKPQPWYNKLNPYAPKYTNKDYIKILKSKLKGNMSDFVKPTFITAASSTGEQEKVFDKGDVDMPKWKAVLASSAAPTFFDPVDGHWMDGGLFANNPADCLQSGLVSSIYNGNYRMLSFGTGGTDTGKSVKNMNIVSWATYLLGGWLAKAGEASSYRVKKNIGESNFLRIKPILIKDYSMDDLAHIPEMEKVWDDAFDETFINVKMFLEGQYK